MFPPGRGLFWDGGRWERIRRGSRGGVKSSIWNGKPSPIQGEGGAVMPVLQISVIPIIRIAAGGPRQAGGQGRCQQTSPPVNSETGSETGDDTPYGMLVGITMDGNPDWVGWRLTLVAARSRNNGATSDSSPMCRNCAIVSEKMATRLHEMAEQARVQIRVTMRLTP